MIQITKVFVSSFDKRGMQKDQLPFVTVDPLCLISVKKTPRETKLSASLDSDY